MKDLSRAGRGACVLVALTSLSLNAPVPALGAGPGLEIVGRHSLADRGMNAALALAGHCAWVGSRNDAPVQVLDIATPAAPFLLGSLPAHPGSTPRELRAVDDQHLLVVLYYRLHGGPNRYDIFHWDTDCASPTLVGHWDFGTATPHEFYLWRDPGKSARILLYTAMFASASTQLQVLDISVPGAPRMVGGWAVPAAYGRAPLHSVDISADGKTAYLSLWTGGLVVADVSEFVAGATTPALRPRTDAGSSYRTPPGNVHSAVPLDGGRFLLVTDERYPVPFGAGCPFGSAHIIDVQDPARPAAVATLAVPENAPGACASAPGGTFTSHNPTLTAHLALVTWYSAGLQVFDLADPTRPTRITELRPTGASPRQRDLELGTTDAMSWSYPVVSNGLVYVVDINQGLLVLRYTGPHQQEVEQARFVEGNSSLGAQPRLPPPSATPASSGSAPPTLRPTPRLRGTTPASKPDGAWAAAAVAAALLLGLSAAVVQRRRRRRS